MLINYKEEKFIGVSSKGYKTPIKVLNNEKDHIRIEGPYEDNDIIALIPLKDGMIICNEVLKSLNEQTLKIGIMPITRPKEGKKGKISRAICKNTAKQEALDFFDHDKFLFLNCDIIFSSPTDIEDMIRFLNKNEEYGAVALRKSLGNNHHIDIGCMVVRRYVIEQINFKDSNSCDCFLFAKDMNKLKKYNKICYLDNRIITDLYKEI